MNHGYISMSYYIACYSRETKMTLKVRVGGVYFLNKSVVFCDCFWCIIGIKPNTSSKASFFASLRTSITIIGMVRSCLNFLALIYAAAESCHAMKCGLEQRVGCVTDLFHFFLKYFFTADCSVRRLKM